MHSPERIAAAGLRNLLLASIALLACSCATYITPAEKCPPGTQQLENCPPLNAVYDGRTEAIHSYRRWVDPANFKVDTITLGKQAQIDLRSARGKFIGPRNKEALESLAAKLHMIENARHTIDMIYYIYKNDLIGESLMGALCDAVERGVDVRFMVDSAGSILLGGEDMRALDSCQANAGFMLNQTGETTLYKARVQVTIFNPLSNLTTSPNRRSHDKLLVVDGYFPELAAVMTGGRNISLDYYGINADGSPNPYAYKDAEILLRTGLNYQQERFTLGEMTELYYTLLKFFPANRRLRNSALSDPGLQYAKRRSEYRNSLAKLKALPRFREVYAGMPEYFETGFTRTNVRLAHEFGNLVNTRVVTKAVENMDRNPNSITRLIREAGNLGRGAGKNIRLVSPYIFLARYTDKQGNVVVDDAKRIREWLAEDPERSVQIVTNSILTSDNGGAQSVIDMDMAPRLFLSEEMQDKWLNNPKETELNPELLSDTDWQRMVNNPQLKVYQTGRMDSEILGGDFIYGKLHAKFIVTDNYGFVGTANFDYRSRLFNNEMGFFVDSPELLAEMMRDFDFMVEYSYRWGSPEWLEMRKRLREAGGAKSRSVKNQRRNYKFLRATGLKWLF